MFGKIADLTKAFAAMRPDTDIAARNLIVEIEEKQTNRFTERDGGDQKHQPLHPQRRKTDGAGHRSPRDRRYYQRQDERPCGKHRQHACDIGADSEKAGLRKAHLAGQQHTIGRQSKQGVNADDLQEAEIEIHLSSLAQSRPADGANRPPGQNTRKTNNNSMT